MKWLFKAAMQNIFSVMPWGDQINHFMKIHITHSLPLSHQTIMRKFKYAQDHFNQAQKYGAGQKKPLKAFEFGAGTQPTVPLCLYMLGVEQQVCMDIKHLLYFDLLNQAIDTYKASHTQLEEMAGRPLRPLADQPVQGAQDLEDLYGITYLAPADSADTGLEAAQFDLGFSTMVLEHVPERYIGPMLSEYSRLLKPGGVASLLIDLRDHYSYFDKSISNYNYLRFGPFIWRLVNNSTNFQNRLRLPEYKQIVQASGLKLVGEEMRALNDRELEILSGLKLHRSFQRGYSPAELGAKQVLLVGVKDTQEDFSEV